MCKILQITKMLLLLMLGFSVHIQANARSVAVISMFENSLQCARTELGGFPPVFLEADIYTCDTGTTLNLAINKLLSKKVVDKGHTIIETNSGTNELFREVRSKILDSVNKVKKETGYGELAFTRNQKLINSLLPSFVAMKAEKVMILVPSNYHPMIAQHKNIPISFTGQKILHHMGGSSYIGGNHGIYTTFSGALYIIDVGTGNLIHNDFIYDIKKVNIPRKITVVEAEQAKNLLSKYYSQFKGKNLSKADFLPVFNMSTITEDDSDKMFNKLKEDSTVEDDFDSDTATEEFDISEFKNVIISSQVYHHKFRAFNEMYQEDKDKYFDLVVGRLVTAVDKHFEKIDLNAIEAPDEEF